MNFEKLLDASHARYLRLLPTILIFGMIGCSQLPNVEYSRLSTVAVLINSRWVEHDSRGIVWEVRQEEQDLEQQFAACVRQAASATDLPIQVITGTQFRAALFPDLDPKVAPRSIESLRSLLPDPRFRKRINSSHINYLAILGGETHTSETQGGIVCASGMGAGACFGSLWWDHESKLSALIVDLRSGSEHQSTEIHAADSSWFAMIAILPLAAPSTHVLKGCEHFGHAVTKVVREMQYKGD